MYFLRERINRISSIGQLVLHLALMLGLIHIASHDTGMMVVYICIFLSMALAAGIYFRWFLLAGGLTAAAAPFIWNKLLDEYQRMRVLVVLNPELDPQGKGLPCDPVKNRPGCGQAVRAGTFQRNAGAVEPSAGQAYRFHLFRGR